MAAVAVGLFLWLVPAAAALVSHQTLPSAGIFSQIFGTVRILTDGHTGDPQMAYPPRARESLPGGVLFYVAAAVPLGLAAAGGWLGWVRLDRVRVRARLARRAGDPRGSATRAFARGRDVPALVVTHRTGDRFTVGELDRRTLAAEDESHVLVVAPPKAGKTVRLVIPWLLEHDGPAVVTSSKTDVIDATRQWREQAGNVFVWDPFEGGTACWTPLDGCEDWSFAIRQAQWLADAKTGAEPGTSHYWNEEAAKLLAPLLHAAALAGCDMSDVLRWVDLQTEDEPLDILKASGNDAAHAQLEGILKHESRNRSTNYMSTGHLLGAYRHPEVLATTKSGFNPEQFLDGGAHTLYICASEHNQKLLAPIIVAMITSILHRAREVSRQGHPQKPYLRMLLDETAQIAQLPNLPAQLAEARSHGIRFATVWQSIAQLQERYKRDAGTILASSTTKLYMGPITDEPTRREILGLLGEEPDPDRPGARRPVATSQELAQLEPGRGLLLAGTNLPAIVTLKGYGDIKELAPRTSGTWRPPSNA